MFQSVAAVEEHAFDENTIIEELNISGELDPDDLVRLLVHLGECYTYATDLRLKNLHLETCMERVANALNEYADLNAVTLQNVQGPCEQLVEAVRHMQSLERVTIRDCAFEDIEPLCRLAEDRHDVTLWIEGDGITAALIDALRTCPHGGMMISPMTQRYKYSICVNSQRG